jgi:thymidylate synthase
MPFAQQVIDSPLAMRAAYSELAQLLLDQTPVDRGEVHAQKITDADHLMIEIPHMSLVWSIETTLQAWQETVEPNLPWAEDHFLERISGQPLNPPPSNEWWPYAQQGNAVHKKDEKFSHTYPERFWPIWAEQNEPGRKNEGIRFPYGDLADLVEIIRNNPLTRQAYLPVWFPEDLHASLIGERVPCTLGYHFISSPHGVIDCVYFMRSCDLVRFFRDDVYMAGRLCHYVASQTGLIPGNLVVHISNLHAFTGDRAFLQSQVIVPPKPDPRAGYNFDALG